MAQATPSPRDRGFALLLVLWTLVLVTVVASRLIAGGRDEIQLAANLRAAATAEMLADAGVHEAIFHLLDRSGQGWTADATPHRLLLPGGVVTVRAEDQSGLVNPNSASEALLQALLRGVGTDAGTARSVAAAMMDWRAVAPQARPFGAKEQEYRAAGRDYGPPQSPFRSIEEIGLVLGVTPALLERLVPHLTIFYDGDPNPAHASPLVLQALRDAAGQSDIGGNTRAQAVTVAVIATAEGQAGGRFTRRAVLRLGVGDRQYRTLDWRRADG